jgi:iron(II)-dependent oxidoreductase
MNRIHSLSAINEQETPAWMLSERVQDHNQILPRFAIIPAGPALIGNNDGFPDEMPKHSVDIPTFMMSVFPITNKQYARFLHQTYMPAPCHWDDPHFNQDDQPVVGVTWYAANSYCQWLQEQIENQGQLYPDYHVRLPTEQEWEKAASWNPICQKSQRYPWGDIWDDSRALTAANSQGHPSNVHSYCGGASAYGIYGMLGNVWEWTTSPYLSYTALNPYHDFQDSHYVIRGGSCTLKPTHLRCSYRCHLPPCSRRSHLGFRIVIGPKQH